MTSDESILSRATNAMAAWLLRHNWRGSFDKASLAKGQTMLGLVGKVHAVESKNLTTISAHVASQSAPNVRYLATLTLRSDGLRVHCTCPVEGNCKHLAAFMLRLEAGKVAQVTSAVSNAIAPSAQDGANHSQHWLQQNLAAWKNWIAQQQSDAALKTARARESQQAAIGKRMVYVFSVNRAGKLSLSVLQQTRSSKGGYSAGQKIEVMRSSYLLATQLSSYSASEAEQELIRELATMYGNNSYTHERELIGSSGERFVEEILARYPAFFGNTKTPIVRGAPRSAKLAWRAADDGELQLRVLQDDSTAKPIDTCFVVKKLWFVDVIAGEIGTLENLSMEDFKRSLSMPSISAGNAEAVSHLLQSTGVTRGIVTPVRFKRTHIKGLAVARMALVQMDSRESSTSLWLGKLQFDYGLAVVPDDRQEFVNLREGDALTIVERDQAFEFGVFNQLLQLNLKEIRPSLQSSDLPSYWVPLVHANAEKSAEAWLENRDTLAKHKIELILPPSFPLKLMDAPDEWTAELQEEAGAYWFNVELGIEIDGEKVSLLPIIARALASKELSIVPMPGELEGQMWIAKIDQRRRLRLPLARVRQFCAPILEWLDKINGNSVRLPNLRADVLNDYQDATFQLRSSQTLQRLAQTLRELNALQAQSALSPAKTIQVPQALNATLRDYQLAGLEWLNFLASHGLGGILADDMGLGKTIQILAHVLSQRERQADRDASTKPDKAKAKTAGKQAATLVVMPTSLIPNWQAESARFAPSLKCLTLHGSARGALFARIAKFDLVFTTYALLVRDQQLLAKYEFDLVVFDEAQALKNASAKTAAAARLIPARRRIAMTGTPIENHLGELWAQMDLVLPGLLGSLRAFTSQFRTPIEKHKDLDQQRRLHIRLRPFLLRRSKQQVASELPPKTEVLTRIALEGPQRELYESLRLAMHKRVREAIKKRGLASSAIVVLDALLKLRQVCCDPRLVKLPNARGIDSAKREHLLTMLQELHDEGRKILLFSQFTEMLDLLQTDIVQAGIPFTRLDGSTVDRALPVRRFQAGEVPLMLISLKAGGVGLNLTAADTVIHYDPWWNPAVENQATDRAHRIGQDKSVFVYKFVCTDTVEDKILELQANKAQLAEAILSEGSSASLRFDAASIDALFGVSSEADSAPSVP